jgi:cell wall-associated NlpC family hydrolase
MNNAQRAQTAATAAIPAYLGMFLLVMPFLILGAGGNAPVAGDCGGGGTAQRIAGVTLDAEQLGNATVIISTIANDFPDLYQYGPYAAVIAVDTAYTESTLYNTSTHTDHDSEGLFQQRISIYGKQTADNPTLATTEFVVRLEQVTGWQHQPAGVDAQAVQHSRYRERYPPNVPLAQALVDLQWPLTGYGKVASTALKPAPKPRRPQTTAMPWPSHSSQGQLPGLPFPQPTIPFQPTKPSSARPSPTPPQPVHGHARRPPHRNHLSRSSQSPQPPTTPPAICAGGGGAGPITGLTGNNIRGSITVPPGFVITGTPAGRAAVRYALQQLGRPYVFGAAGPDTFDCSGLTMAAWAAAGVALPHLAAAQAGMGRPESTTLEQSMGGDLVLIPGSDGTAARPGHVGMIAGYVDKRDGRHLYLIQAPMSGIPVELTEATEWSGQIVAVRHIG